MKTLERVVIPAFLTFVVLYFGIHVAATLPDLATRSLGILATLGFAVVAWSLARRSTS